MTYRCLTNDDCPLLAELNHQLMQNAGRRNRMSLPDLEQRVKHWLAGEYRGILFEAGGEVVAYALFRERIDEIYLRQFFVVRHRRRQGIARQALQILRSHVWPKSRRLTIDVVTANQEAAAFWKAVGCEVYSLTLEMLSGQSEPILRQLAAGEADRGYAVYLEAFRWLNDHGIRQWLVPVRRDIHDRRQAQGENLGLFVGGELAVFLSLVEGTPAEWADHVAEKGTWWLHNVATAQSFRGKKLGALAVRLVGEQLARAGVREVYLDCVDVGGFLPAFYTRLGFAKVCEQSITYTSGNTFPMVLMRKAVNDA